MLPLPAAAPTANPPRTSGQQSEQQRNQRSTGEDQLLPIRHQALRPLIEQGLSSTGGMKASALAIGSSERGEEGAVGNDLEKLGISRADRKHRLALIGSSAPRLYQHPVCTLDGGGERGRGLSGGSGDQ